MPGIMTMPHCAAPQLTSPRPFALWRRMDPILELNLFQGCSQSLQPSPSTTFTLQGASNPVVHVIFDVNTLTKSYQEKKCWSPFLITIPLLHGLPQVSLHLPPCCRPEGHQHIMSLLLGGSLSNWGWKKASLPSSLGGLNLRQLPPCPCCLPWLHQPHSPSTFQH